MNTLEGKVAIVTGASRGIGRGISQALAAEGAALVVHATQREHLEPCLQQLKEQFGGQYLAMDGDIAQSSTSEQLVQAAMDTFGHLDIVVGCAGINRDGMIHKLSNAVWERVLAVNLSGVFYLTRAAAHTMRQQQSGRIIHISSIARHGNLGQANYAASKAGVVALTQTAALELGPLGITCNAICPGFIDTDMTRTVPSGAQDRMLARIPARRIGTPEEVGAAVAFLASDQAGYINGQVLDVSGGLTL